MNSYFKAYKFLKELSFERIGGTDNELKAAKIIQDKISSLGFLSELEEFEVDGATILTQKLKVIGKNTYELNCHGYKMSGSTGDDGISAELVYLESIDLIDQYDLKGKIVLLHNYVNYKTYKKIYEAGVVGFIHISGTVYDNPSSSDLEVASIRKALYDLGKIVGVSIRATDAQKLIESLPCTVNITLKQKEQKLVSRNVVTTVEGSDRKDEIIALTAHYDSVIYSSGAYDNASGSVALFELLKMFKNKQPRRTLKFIWCGSEEMGLMGSKAYVKKHKEELDKYVFCLNIDMVGVILGKEIAVSTANQDLVNYISILGKEIGVPVTSTQGVYSSDSTPFADNGVPATSFARISPESGAKIHTRKDMIKFLSPKAFISSMSLISTFLSRIDKASIFPIKREIPDNMKLELDYYLLRKEKQDNKN